MQTNGLLNTTYKYKLKKPHQKIYIQVKTKKYDGHIAMQRIQHRIPVWKFSKSIS